MRSKQSTAGKAKKDENHHKVYHKSEIFKFFRPFGEGDGLEEREVLKNRPDAFSLLSK